MIGPIPSPKPSPVNPKPSRCLRYARQLADSSDEDAVTFWMASGDVAKVVSFFESVGDLPDAFLTASSSLLMYVERRSTASFVVIVSCRDAPLVRADDVAIPNESDPKSRKNVRYFQLHNEARNPKPEY